MNLEMNVALAAFRWSDSLRAELSSGPADRDCRVGLRGGREPLNIEKPSRLRKPKVQLIEASARIGRVG